MSNRRRFLQAAAAFAAAGTAQGGQDPAAEPKPVIMTVNGPVPPSRIGNTLCHEHVMVDFIGADKAVPARYDVAEVERVVLPQLKELKELGCSCLIECTPIGLARDPGLLRRLSAASGLHIVTNTGYYAANGGKHLPATARTESADQIAARWLTEATAGIGETGVSPGFIKIGVDAGPLSEVARKLVVAAARVHKQSGLTIASHTGDSEAAVAQLKLLVAEEIDPSAWIWVHAQNETDSAVHVQAGALGAWVEFDGISPTTIDQHVKLVDAMRRAGLLNRVLISQDAGWYHVGESGGGTFRPYTTLFRDFLPALKGRGFSDTEIQGLIQDNPKQAFQIRQRVPQF